MFDKLNFERVFESFKKILNLWKSRTLSLFGKNEVIKSLALPKLFYVTSMAIPPKPFLDKVKNEIVKFMWSNRRPKIAYKVLISNKDQGGIGLPDIYSRIKTQKIMVIKRLLSVDSLAPWKLIPLRYLNPIVGRENVNLNFDVDKIPKFIPKFYEVCLTEFSKFVRKSPVTKEEILNQPVWNNVCIKHHSTLNIIDNPSILENYTILA